MFALVMLLFPSSIFIYFKLYIDLTVLFIYLGSLITKANHSSESRSVQGRYSLGLYVIVG